MLLEGSRRVFVNGPWCRTSGGWQAVLCTQPKRHETCTTARCSVCKWLSVCFCCDAVSSGRPDSRQARHSTTNWATPQQAVCFLSRDEAEIKDIKKASASWLSQTEHLITVPWLPGVSVAPCPLSPGLWLALFNCLLAFCMKHSLCKPSQAA